MIKSEGGGGGAEVSLIINCKNYVSVRKVGMSPYVRVNMTIHKNI